MKIETCKIQRSNGQPKGFEWKWMTYVSLFLAVTLLFTTSCTESDSQDASTAYLLVNSTTNSEVAATKLVPYLEHYGVNFKTIDIAKEGLPSTGSPALVIIGHAEIASEDMAAQVEAYLEKCQMEGIGILSFDPCMPKGLVSNAGSEIEKDTEVGVLTFSDATHYITGYREPGETKELFGFMALPKLSVEEGRAIITGNNHPLLVVNDQEKGRVAQWTSQDWMYYSILGPLGGLDDCLWKSIVWAARKPFVMQAMPPIATMRVDDVMGTGRQQWDVRPFEWVRIANKYGFKPWMGLFIYNISPEGLEELHELLPAGMATGTPHAFGRPPRIESTIPYIVKTRNPYYRNQMAATHFVPDYWYPEAIPFLSEYYDEFIYFDHNNQKPWPADVSQKILKAVDDWYADTGIPMGEYVVPHWGEITGDMMPHIHDNWNISLVGVREVDVSWGQQTPEYNLKEGKQPVRTYPFRQQEEPIIGKKKEGAMTSRASYNAGFRELGGRTFFDFSSVVNDITGYEWQPDNDVEATADRGIKVLSRGLEGKYMAVLFTHETDYIYDVKPENWDEILKKVSEGIARYEPMYLTTDDGLKIQRSFYTSEISGSSYSPKTGELQLKMSGRTDVKTNVFVYTDNGDTVHEALVEIPVFEAEATKTLNISN